MTNWLIPCFRLSVILKCNKIGGTIMRSPIIPPEAEVVRTFAEYHQLVTAFFAGFFHLLIISWSPWVG